MSSHQQEGARLGEAVGLCVRSGAAQEAARTVCVGHSAHIRIMLVMNQMLREQLATGA